MSTRTNCLVRCRSRSVVHCRSGEQQRTRHLFISLVRCRSRSLSFTSPSFVVHLLVVHPSFVVHHLSFIPRSSFSACSLLSFIPRSSFPISRSPLVRRSPSFRSPSFVVLGSSFSFTRSRSRSALFTRPRSGLSFSPRSRSRSRSRSHLFTENVFLFWIYSTHLAPGGRPRGL